MAFFAVSAYSGTIRIYGCCMDKFNHIGTLNYEIEHGRDLRLHGFSNDSFFLVSSFRKEIIIWDIATIVSSRWPVVMKNWSVQICCPGVVKSVSVDATASRLTVQTTEPHYLIMYELPTQSEQWRVETSSVSCSSVYFARNDEVVISAVGADEAGQAFLSSYDSATGSVVSNILLAEGLRPGHAIQYLAFHATGSLVAAVISGASDIAFVRMAPSCCASTAKPLQLHGHSSPVNCVRFNNCGTKLFSAGGDGTVRIWSSETLETLITFATPVAVHCISINPDTEHIACAGNAENVRVYDGDSGLLISKKIGCVKFGTLCYSSVSSVVLM
jgi:WD40 repeat protein